MVMLVIKNMSAAGDRHWCCRELCAADTATDARASLQWSAVTLGRHGSIDKAMKTFYKGHTKSGSALTRLILHSVRLHGSLIDAAGVLMRPLGITSAQWHVISCAARAAQPAPVAHLAREMGVTRQSVQRLTDQMAQDGLIEYGENPNHKRAALVVLTEKGSSLFEAATKRQVGWVNALAQEMTVENIEGVTALLVELERRLKKARRN